MTGKTKDSISPLHAFPQIELPDLANARNFRQSAWNRSPQGNGFCIGSPHIHLDLVRHPTEGGDPQGNKGEEVGNQEIAKGFRDDFLVHGS